MWLFQHFMRYSAKVAFAHLVCATRCDTPEKEGKLTAYCQVVNYPLGKNAIVNIKAEAEDEIGNF